MGMVFRRTAGLWALLAALAPALTAPSASSTAATPTSYRTDLHKAGPRYRLPEIVVPTAYTVDLVMDATTDTFTGTVNIKATARRAANFVTLHVDHNYITISKAKVGTLDSTAVTQTADTELQTLTLSWTQRAGSGDKTTGELTPGTQYDIYLEFSGKLRTDMYGFYLSSYKTVDANNKETTIRVAATQFEPTHARSAFPCFDEPHLKATFTLSITHAATQFARSNTPGTTTTTTTTDVKKTQFEVTPIMSTYLVAFVVSGEEFLQPTGTEATPAPAVTYSVLVRPSLQQQAAYAKTVGYKLLDWMSTYTGLPYVDTMGLKKLDLIAIPDFAAGAMENWGLITFREAGLMFSEGVSTEASRESTALVIAHEQAHMWFGDLVSPKWWGDVWLNEGFASYMSYVALDQVNPLWQLMDVFPVVVRQAALAVDGLAGTHPMSASVYSPDEIQAVFDDISYDKAASVLHMTRHIMGDSNFKTALTAYLKEMKFYAAEPHDLFRALDSVSSGTATTAFTLKLPDGVSLADVLTTWTSQAGYPVVTLEVASDGKITVSQARFSSSGSSDAVAARWWVPLTYVAAGGDFTKPSATWLDPNVNTTTLAAVTGGPVVANARQTGFYRVNYDDAHWARLASQLNTAEGVQKVDALNRAQLLDDALSLAAAGVLSYPTALDLLKYLHLETDPLPWRSVLGHLSTLHKMLAGDSAQTTFQEFVLGKLATVYDSVGFPETETDYDKDHQKLVFRAILLDRACRLGHQGCVGNASAVFSDFIKSSKAVPPSQQRAVYCSGLRHSDVQTDWDAVWKLYTTSTHPDERDLLLGALGCCRTNTTLTKFLGYSLDETQVRRQDAASVFTAVLRGNDENVDVAFQFFQDNFDKMNAGYGGWSAMQKVVEGLASSMADESHIKQLETFLLQHIDSMGVAKAAALRSVEKARENLNWRSRHLATVSAWVRGSSTNGAAGLTGAATIPTVLLAALLLALCR